MTCPRCGTGSDTDSACQQCGYRPVLDVRAQPNISDHAWFRLVDEVTAGGSRFATANQLYAAFCRHWHKENPPHTQLVWILVLATLALFLASMNDWALLTLIGAVVTRVISRRKPPEPKLFMQAHQAMTRAGNRNRFLLEKPSLPLLTEHPLPDYDPVCLLIVERSLLVDLLVANDIHRKAQALIISAGGYPGYLMALAAKLLEERTHFPVYLLHDATLKGQRMETFLKESDSLPFGNHTIKNLGLTDEQAASLFRHPGPVSEDGWPVDLMRHEELFPGLIQAMENGTAPAPFQRADS